jgi:hypothetical protein
VSAPRSTPPPATDGSVGGVFYAAFLALVAALVMALFLRPGPPNFGPLAVAEPFSPPAVAR